jgi:amino acid transporter
LTALLAGAFSVAIYFIVPLTLVGVLGAQNIQEDANIVLIPFAELTTHHASPAVLLLLLISLLLASNMIIIASSRSIYQMSKNGYTWKGLSTLNRNGVPGNALIFDMGFNLLLLAVMAIINGGELGQAPVSLLAAANVAYFISIVLGLIAVWTLHFDGANAGSRYRASRYVGGVGLGLALVNTALLAGAGAAWGWGNIGLGVLILVMGISLFIFVSGNKRLVFEKPLGGTADEMVLGSLVVLSIMASIPHENIKRGVSVAT